MTCSKCGSEKTEQVFTTWFEDGKTVGRSWSCPKCDDPKIQYCEICDSPLPVDEKCIVCYGTPDQAAVWLWHRIHSCTHLKRVLMAMRAQGMRDAAKIAGEESIDEGDKEVK